MPHRARARHGQGRTSPLERLDRVLDECAGGHLRQRQARKRALTRARAAIEAAAGNERLAVVALLAYAADVVVANAVELATECTQLRRLVERVEAEVGIPRVALAREVLPAPQLLQLPTAAAIEVELALLLAFSEASGVSLWTVGADGEPTQIAHAGALHPDHPHTRGLARKLLVSGEDRPERARDVVGALVRRAQRPDAALIVRGKAAAASVRRPMLDHAASMLTAMLERDELLARGSRTEEAVRASAERRLTRLRYDLHDGPQQDVILLAEDVQLLRDQLEVAMDGRPQKSRVLGRLDDLQARLVALDGDLRRIAAFVRSPFMQEEPIPDALVKLTDEFAARTGIEPDVRLDGDFTTLTDSQQITLLGLIREALSNIREHSHAQRVTITLSAGAGGVEATVTDDGRGFVPETTLVEAARAGHLGLVGMHERVRLLGGRTQIESRPGGPTVISVRLPAYTLTPEAPGPAR